MTPIQLTIDRLSSKYSKKLENSEKNDFSKNLEIIAKQIKQIENLVNEFSDFARMPKPILKDNDIILLIDDNINLLKILDQNIDIKFHSNKKRAMFNSDYEQLSRVFFNLIKNSIESIQEKALQAKNLKGNINIEIIDNNDYMELSVVDNGMGFVNIKDNIKNILNPYFTTKKKGVGLGLAIVNKIINDHNGSIKFIRLDNGAKIQILFKRK